MWGFKTDTPPWVRMLVVFVVVGSIGLALVETFRYVDRKEAKKQLPEDAALNVVNYVPHYPFGSNKKWRLDLTVQHNGKHAVQLLNVWNTVVPVGKPTDEPQERQRLENDLWNKHMNQRPTLLGVNLWVPPRVPFVIPLEDSLARGPEDIRRAQQGRVYFMATIKYSETVVPTESCVYVERDPDNPQAARIGFCIGHNGPQGDHPMKKPETPTTPPV